MKTARNHRGRGWPILVTLTLTVALGAIGAKANAQEAVYLVQYAEKDLTGKGGLTDVGRRKAKELARILMDAGIDVIYSFERSHVVQTAEPTAKALKIKINILRFEIEAMDDLVRRLPTQHGKDRVLVVTGPPSRERIFRGLGLDEEVWKARTDNLYIIIPRLPQEPLVIKMRW